MHEATSTQPKPYKILSIDGGGTFCLLQAKVLLDLYGDVSGHDVLKNFDMVAGCSGGAIVAALLADNQGPKAILALFLTRAMREQLFSPLKWYERWMSLVTGAMGSAVGPRFSTQNKLAFLQSVLPNVGDLRLHQLGERVGSKIGKKIDFMFVTYDLGRERAKMMRSCSQSAAANFPRNEGPITVAQAVHASSTAPINWFQEPAVFHQSRYWDGAMTGYNNPCLAAVTEAIACGVAPEDIGLLSLGSTTVYPKIPEGDSFLSSLTKVSELIVTDPPDAHSFIAHTVLGGRMPARHDEPVTHTALVRMNPVIQKIYDPVSQTFIWPPSWSPADVARLRQLDISTVKDEDVNLIVRLTDEWMRDGWNNQPLRSGGGLYDAMSETAPPMAPRDAEFVMCEIGQHHYGAAKKVWLAL